MRGGAAPSDWQSDPHSVLNLSPTGDCQKSRGHKNVSLRLHDQVKPYVTSEALRGSSASLGTYVPPHLTLGGIKMKHQNIRSKADRVALKRKHERRQAPHRRQEGISVRKTIKAFIYDVFEDGYLIGQLVKSARED